MRDLFSFFFFYYVTTTKFRVLAPFVRCFLRHVCAPPTSRSKERRLGFQEHRPQPRSSVAPSKPSSRSRSAVVALTSVLINHNTQKAESENQKRERPTRGQVRRAANPGGWGVGPGGCKLAAVLKFAKEVEQTAPFDRAIGLRTGDRCGELIY